MSPDWRKQKMESAEGSGKARAAWDRVPGTNKAAFDRSSSGGLRQELSVRETEGALGFWLLWHIHGGFDGLRRFGMSRSTIYKQISRFRAGFGEHPDDFCLPGITIDVAMYWAGALEAEERRRNLVAEQGAALG